MTPVGFAVLALVSWRAASLLAEDKVLAAPRSRVVRSHPPRNGRPHPVAVLATCCRCLSVWTSAAAAAGGWALGAVDGWRWSLLAWGGCSGASALLAQLAPAPITPTGGDGRQQ